MRVLGWLGGWEAGWPAVKVPTGAFGPPIYSFRAMIPEAWEAWEAGRLGGWLGGWEGGWEADVKVPI